MPKKEQIRKMFDDIAPGYDAFNHLGSLGIDKCWRRRALRELPKPVEAGSGAVPAASPATGSAAVYRVLDIACGTGDFCIAAAKYLSKRLRRTARATGHGRLPDSVIGHRSEPETPAFQIIGADISTGMLAVMSDKVAAAGLQELVSVEEGDCASLQFSDGSFDAVTVAFGVRNFEDRELCLAEILRVLKPGGRFIMLELGVPSCRPVAWLYRIYFTKILPLLGGKMSGNRRAYEYLPASVLAFPGKREWLATLAAAGFRNCRHRALSFGICRLYIASK